ncbi:uncharacterized protein TRIVIDRAFT_198688 [Trichoderma virens Gv29-8]|uniref:Uncharacterized protein n=1 Tax=Hypocrea virens (strain Gv29-8 / FGSC 10586) TaxID=413071 RepID=G9MJT1_HYPVG|nr:uncharacterized protein TRIVIDRAFT_198688 [Trichoderma virens Gv29-8]EHK25742.1 hypothetical protein TRIVIDRAFT_198688 [Trichoderma virens Gv29-8]
MQGKADVGATSSKTDFSEYAREAVREKFRPFSREFILQLVPTSAEVTMDPAKAPRSLRKTMVIDKRRVVNYHNKQSPLATTTTKPSHHHHPAMSQAGQAIQSTMDNTFAQMPQTDDEMVELIKLVVEVVRKDQLAGDLREFQKQEEFEFKTLPRHKERMAEIDRWMSVSRAQQQKSKRENPSRFDWGDYHGDLATTRYFYLYFQGT